MFPRLNHGGTSRISGRLAHHCGTFSELIELKQEVTSVISLGVFRVEYYFREKASGPMDKLLTTNSGAAQAR